MLIRVVSVNSKTSYGRLPNYEKHQRWSNVISPKKSDFGHGPTLCPGKFENFSLFAPSIGSNMRNQDVGAE